MTAAAPLTLAQMTQRRAELASDLQAAQAELLMAQERLISGSTKPQTVVTLQNTVSALEGALGTASERVDQLTKEDEAHKAEAYRQGLLARLTQGAQEAQEHRQAFSDGLSKALAALTPDLQAAFEHLYRLHDLREQWVQALRELDRAQPTPGTALALLETQTDLKAIRTKPLPSSWHHGLTYPYDDSAVQALPPELFRLWQLYCDLQEQGKLPRRKITGIGL